MTADLLIIVPTRRRRANVERFIEAFDATREARTDLLILADDGDGSYDGLTLPARCDLVSQERAQLGPKINRYAVPLAQIYPAIGFLADDCVPETPGWDATLLSYLDVPGIAYPENGRRRDIGEHQVISSQIIRALGWYFEPSLMHYWTDTVLADLGRAAGCYRYVPEAVVTHRHYDCGGRHDEVYAESVEANGSSDAIAYQHWRAQRMAADIETVRGAIA